MDTAASPTTDIVIVFYGERTELDACLASIETHCTRYKVHIVDNNKENVGFTRGVNKGILNGTAPYVWLLNQDALVLKGAQ
jgi:GT2 family glycosyltransferase